MIQGSKCDKTIDFNEFESYLKARDTKGNGLTDKDIQKIFEDMDSSKDENGNKDGKVDLEEFTKAIKKYYIRCNCDEEDSGIQNSYDILENPFCQQ